MNILDIAFVRAEADYKLDDVFNARKIVPNLACDPAEAIVMHKFLLALCLAAVRPQTNADLAALTNATLAAQVSDYLQRNRALFELAGDKPFLQYPAARAAKLCPVAGLIPGMASGNRGVVRTTELMPNPTPADRVRALLFAVILPFAGKKTDATVWLMPGQKEKKKAFLAPALGMGGVVHSFVLGETLLDTLRLNLVSEEDLKGPEFTSGLGTPAWERMPLERDTAAEELKTSYIGRLVPMLRFVLMEGEQLHITYGVQPESTIAEPTASVWTNAKGDRRMARMLSGAHWSAIASAYGYGLKEGETAVCRQLAWCLPRARTDKAFAGCWIAGVRTSYNSGEQYFGSGDEMFAWRFAADGSEDALREKFAFMRKLSSAVYASLSQLRQVIEAPKLDSRIAIQSTPAKTFVSSRHDALMSELTDDFGELLAVTGAETIKTFEMAMAQKARFGIHRLVEMAGTKCRMMAGRIEFNPHLLFVDSKGE